MKRILITLCSLFSFFVNGRAQLMNPGLEQWDSVFSAYYPAEWPLLSSSILARTTDAHSGNFALEVSVWYYYTETVATQVVPIDYRPTAFCGWYKYTENVLQNQVTNLITDDTAYASVYLTKWNTTTNMTDTIGQGRIELLGTDVYQHFSCPVNYSSAAMPDTVIIAMDPSMMRNGGTYFSTSSSGYNSYLKIDDLYLQRWATSVPYSRTTEFSITPNPAGDFIQVTASGSGDLSCIITDLTGRCVLRNIVTGGSGRIMLGNLPAGPYIISVSNSENSVSSKTFVHQ